MVWIVVKPQGAAAFVELLLVIQVLLTRYAHYLAQKEASNVYKAIFVHHLNTELSGSLQKELFRNRVYDIFNLHSGGLQLTRGPGYRSGISAYNT